MLPRRHARALSFRGQREFGSESALKKWLEEISKNSKWIYGAARFAYICENWQTPSRLLGTLIGVRFTNSGETDFRIAEVLEKTCEALQHSLCRMLAAFAPRCALENASILLACGEPPYPVAIWTEEWLKNSLRKFLRSHGKRLFRQLLSKDGTPFSSRMSSFNENVR